ncbi:arsenical-resistance protein ACR3 [Armillaria solidipes]|uniref:Arsenical-resistance protein ACR3 n=1 Tax=Armillaria solidipes TaxID=1076256 RepID=A0A2H3CC71_9AGAR|nr:arsenical-resistance protein ACR3 [Armillaria solidipes]
MDPNSLHQDNITSCPSNQAVGGGRETQSFSHLWKSLSWIDRLLAPLVLLAIILGVIIGVYAEEGVEHTFKQGATWDGVSIPILIGLLVMIWPALAKVQWERLPDLFRNRNIWLHLAISFVLNWIIAPFIMLAVAWMTLPEQSMERERKGLLLVGVARCIAMVLIWNTISCGDNNYCAILVVFNSLLQVVLFSPYAVLFLNYMGGRSSDSSLDLDYSDASRAVGIYLGIPLAAGLITRMIVLSTMKPSGISKFFKYFGLLAPLGLLYTIIVLFANQGKRIVDNIGTVFRICVPLILYFSIVWTATFFAFWALSRRHSSFGGYEKAVTQSFTAGSNNFELAIAVGIASFGPDSPEVLAATLGPLVEVPVLLSLSYLALWLRERLNWEEISKSGGEVDSSDVERK